MKKLTLLITLILGFAMQSLADDYGHYRINSYADAFVFDEMGVTFSVYPDGEFDFYINNLNGVTTTGYGYSTFNSGYNYNPYVQYDDFGAVVQVENVPIYYDYYGRVSQIGNVPISYRHRRVCQVGGLRVFYNRRGYYAYHTGFINFWNPYFVYRPFYVAFAHPTITLCFVRSAPYRQFYSPVRYIYYRPYVNNYRTCYAKAGTVYRPRTTQSKVSSKYVQSQIKNERPVIRERKKVTVKSGTVKPRVPNNVGVNKKPSSYSRPVNRAKPQISRPVQRTNTRNASPQIRSVRPNKPSTVQPRPRVNTSNRPSYRPSSKPTQSRSRSVKPSSGSRVIQNKTIQSRGNNSRTKK